MAWIPRCGTTRRTGRPECGELTCADNPLATHFFTLVGGNTVDDCGRDPKVLAAFNALMKNTAAAESADREIPSLRERLLSGPSGPGELLVLQGEPWWFYTACQAHACPGTALAMLYSPTEAKRSAVLPRAVVCVVAGRADGGTTCAD